MNRKKEHLFEIEIINVFSVTFDQINATLLNKILKKNFLIVGYIQKCKIFSNFTWLFKYFGGFLLYSSTI